MFSDVYIENAALIERLMEIHSNPPILCYGFNTILIFKSNFTSLEIGGICYNIFFPLENNGRHLLSIYMYA